MNNFEEIAKGVILAELEGLKLLSENIPNDLDKAAEAISCLNGRLIVSGIGKSGYVGQKISSSFASTGTRSFYIHPSEASHGDLGMIGEGDIVMLLSNSGETKELLDIISYSRRFSIPIIGITMDTESLLAKNSNYLLSIPKANEASSVNAPTTSSTMMLALGDALVVSVHEHKGFSKEDFAIYHPGGKLGASLLKISSLMHSGNEIPSIKSTDTIGDAIIEMTSKRFGCTAILDKKANLVGVITDGDLRRNISSSLLSDMAINIMTKNPILIKSDSIAAEALSVMSKNSVTSLFVSNNGHIEGIVHIHDLLRAGVK